ncbi:MAG: hypothetical protein KGH63_00295 [Candidatus Micrarchaeota archaeon]|nr:hypothetical protein [Candidatus Micrarchaeota archaeon]
MKLTDELLAGIRGTIESGYYERRAPARREKKSLVEAIEKAHAGGQLPLLAEVATALPEQGLILPGRSSAGELIERLSRAAPAALSLWVEPRLHAGDLRWLAKASGCPVLAKDWVIDARQIVGGDAILLKAPLLAMAGADEHALMEAAHDQDMEVVLEVYTPEQWSHAKATEADIIAVNNHGPNGGGPDIAHTINLLAAHRSGRPIISMQGIRTPAHVRALLMAGASAVEMEAALCRQDDALERIELLRRAVLGKEPMTVS